MQNLKEYLIALIFLFSGCNTKTNTPAPDLFADTSTYLKIYEDPFQNITLNGSPIQLNSLEQRLISLKNNNGLVLYSNGQRNEDPPGSSRVIDLIKKYKLPIKMSADSSFLK